MSTVTSYVWDEENLLVGVLHADGSSESFSYSGDGQRRSKSSFTPQSSLSDLIEFVWDGENILEEVDGQSGEVKAHYTDSPGYWGGLTSLHTEQSAPASTGAQFNAAAFGSAGFNQSSGIAGSGSFYYLFDLQSSTRYLTDGAGNISGQYLCRAFGEEVLDTGSTPNPHRFQGEVGPYTEADDRVWMRLRQYDPETGVWYSSDPIGFTGGDWDLYRFGSNDPVSQVDPLGLAVPAAGAVAVIAACGASCGCVAGMVASCIQDAFKRVPGSRVTAYFKCMDDTYNALHPAAQYAIDACYTVCNTCVARALRCGAGGKSSGKGSGKPKPTKPKKPDTPDVICELKTFRRPRTPLNKSQNCFQCIYYCKGGAGLPTTVRYQYPSCLSGTVKGFVPGTYQADSCDAAVKAGRNLWQIFNE